MDKLDSEILKIAEKCVDLGLTGQLDNVEYVTWIRNNIDYPIENEFEVLFLTACKMGELKRDLAAKSTRDSSEKC